MNEKLRTLINRTMTVHIEFGQSIKTFRGSLIEVGDGWFILDNGNQTILLDELSVCYIEI